MHNSKIHNYLHKHVSEDARRQTMTKRWKTIYQQNYQLLPHSDSRTNFSFHEMITVHLLTSLFGYKNIIIASAFFVTECTRTLFQKLFKNTFYMHYKKNKNLLNWYKKINKIINNCFISIPTTIFWRQYYTAFLY